MVEQDHTAADHFLVSEPVWPRKPISIKVTRFSHFVTGLAVSVSPCEDSTKHGGGLAAALPGSWPWLAELTDGSPWGGSNAVICQDSALWRAKPLLGFECWCKGVATGMSCVCCSAQCSALPVQLQLPEHLYCSHCHAKCCRDKVTT